VIDAHGEHCILFTTRTYGITTGKHISCVRRAIPPDVPVYHVTDPTSPVSESTLDTCRDRVAEKVNKCRASKGAQNLGSIEIELADMRALKAAFKLKGGVPNPDLSREIEKHHRWEAQAIEREFQRGEHNRLLRVAWFERNKKYEIEKLEKFLGISPLPFEVKLGMAYLRLHGTDEAVETTQGARVPLEHVLRVAPLVLDMLKKGKTYKKNGHTIHLGNYTLDEITEDGTVIAGCHKFSKDEIVRFAKTIGLEV
jgi:hypothetical protein